MNFFIQLLVNDPLDDSSLKPFLITFFIPFSELISASEIILFMDFHMNSMGLRSGEYGGRNTSLIPSFLAFLRTFFV